MEVCESVLDADGELIEEVCGEFQVNAETAPMYFKCRLGSKTWFCFGGSFWLEDFPNLDLDLLN